MFTFTKARKNQVHLKLAITGPSGSGKTYSALALAAGIIEGMGGKKRIAFVDTENNSSNLYADKFDFDSINMNPPHLTSKFLDSIDKAIENDYGVLIIDSLSHQWQNLLDRKTQFDNRSPGKNSFTSWAQFGSEHQQLIDKIASCKIHLITTMRSKTEYIVNTESGKTSIGKFGMSPIQRDGLDYEFTTVFDLGLNHYAIPSKDRTGLWSVSTPVLISSEIGESFVEWLNRGSELSSRRPVSPAIQRAIEVTERKLKEQGGVDLNMAIKKNTLLAAAKNGEAQYARPSA